MVSCASWILAIAYMSQGDLTQACTHGELAVQQAPTLLDKVWSESVLAWVWCRVGEAHCGIEVLTRIAALTQTIGSPMSESHMALRLGEAYWRAGAFGSARQTLEAMLDPAEQCGVPFVVASAQRLLGEIALDSNPAQREAPLAAPHFERSIALLQQLKAENELALAYAGYGRLHQQHGDVAQARAYLRRALAIFERLGTLGEPDRIRQLLAVHDKGARHNV